MLAGIASELSMDVLQGGGPFDLYSTDMEAIFRQGPPYYLMLLDYEAIAILCVSRKPSPAHADVPADAPHGAGMKGDSLPMQMLG